MSVPDRYRAPLRTYEPRVETVSITGFERLEFFPEGSAEAALIAPKLGIYAAGGSVQGEYRTVSEVSLARWFLEDTRCVRRVHEGGENDLRLEGQASAEHHYGVAGGLAIAFSSLTLTAFFGFPSPQYAEGSAMLRIYRSDEFLGAATATSRLAYTTTLYTHRRDILRSRALARGMAIREAADQAAAILCGP
jgi:hypothetical protein